MTSFPLGRRWEKHMIFGTKTIGKKNSLKKMKKSFVLTNISQFLFFPSTFEKLEDWVRPGHSPKILLNFARPKYPYKRGSNKIKRVPNFKASTCIHSRSTAVSGNSRWRFLFLILNNSLPSIWKLLYGVEGPSTARNSTSHFINVETSPVVHCFGSDKFRKKEKERKY